jgi:hypothetical protein
MVVRGPIDGLIVRHDLTDERVEILCGRNDVVGLIVHLCDEDVELVQQAPQVGLESLHGFGERLVDLLQLAQAATVEQNRHRRQGLLGGRIGGRRRQRDDRTLLVSLKPIESCRFLVLYPSCLRVCRLASHER